MKEVRLYECGICKSRFTDMKKAEECETNHKVPKKVTGVKWHPITVMKDGRPEKVEVIFHDGSKAIYHR